MPDLYDLLKSINDGDFDDGIDMLQGAVKNRISKIRPHVPPAGSTVETVPFEDEASGTKKIWQVKVGDTAVLDKVRPLYLNGAACTVVGVNRTRVVVTVDRDFLDGQERRGRNVQRWKGRVTCPLNMLVFK